jgi:hypothetical protein
LHFFDGGRTKYKKLQVDPFTLLFGKQIIPSEFVLLRVEGGDDDSDEEVKEEEEADD